MSPAQRLRCAVSSQARHNALAPGLAPVPDGDGRDLLAYLARITYCVLSSGTPSLANRAPGAQLKHQPGCDSGCAPRAVWQWRAKMRLHRRAKTCCSHQIVLAKNVINWLGPVLSTRVFFFFLSLFPGRTAVDDSGNTSSGQKVQVSALGLS